MMKFKPITGAERIWTSLGMAWALYYLACLTVGNIPQYTQKIIWIGAVVVGALTLFTFWNRVPFHRLPQEGVWLAMFTLWGVVTGFPFAHDMELYMRFSKLMLELTLIVIFVSVILKYTGNAKWFYFAYLSVAVWFVLAGEEAVGMDQLLQAQEGSARIASANAVGYYSFLGCLGVLALFPEIKQFWLRVLLLGAGVLSLYGVVLSSSRSALTSLIMAAILWPVLCLMGGVRVKFKAVIGAVVTLVLAYFVFQFIMQETYMGVRFAKSTHLEDNSTQVRLDLGLTGLKLFLKNPVFGCGLGQFGVSSGTGFYAHNELSEILATTGLPGFVFYYGVYLIAWRRLTRSLKRVYDPVFRYRVNIARMALLIMLVTGCLSRINFLGQETMFLLAIVVGIGHWAEQVVQTLRRNEMAASLPQPYYRS